MPLFWLLFCRKTILLSLHRMNWLLRCWSECVHAKAAAAQGGQPGLWSPTLRTGALRSSSAAPEYPVLLWSETKSERL